MAGAHESPRSVFWRRVDMPGHESARLAWAPDGWRISGMSVFSHEGRPCALRYDIRCDDEWRTRRTTVRGWLGDQPVDVEIVVDAAGGWHLNGTEVPAVAGCVDVDLNFSPSTNLLPIRRLSLPVSGSAEVRAAWLRFPSFTLEPLEQRYTNLGEGRYRYESGGGAFVRELAVNEAGFATSYPDFFAPESA